MSKSLEKLSSGFRINRAADDAAGLAISEGLRSQIGGLKVAVRNTQDGISVVQTAEGALTETHSILQRMRDLSVQGSNSGGLNTDAKSNIQSEIVQLKAELDRIATSTTFNGKKLLDGSFSANFQVGANAGETISVAIGTQMGSSGLGVAGVDVTAVGAYTVGNAAAGKVSTAAATNAANATVTITAKGTDTFSGAASGVAPYEALTGTISFGGKTFDLSSVDYSTITTAGATGATDSLAKLNAAAKSALGLTTRPVPGGHDHDADLHGRRRGHRLHRCRRCRPQRQRDHRVPSAEVAAATPTFTAGQRCGRGDRPAWTPPSRRCRPSGPTWVRSRTGSTTPSTTSTSRSRT